MDKKNAARIRPLLIWEILNRETDAQHPITTKELINKLSQRGASCERRALQRDINYLKSLNYPIVKIREKSYSYYLETHKLNDSEINIMLDLVQSSAFLTEEYTWDLMKKIAAFGGGGDEKTEERAGNVLQNSISKTKNIEVPKTIVTIEKALIEKKKITFNYFHLNSDFERCYTLNDNSQKLRYIVSPLNKTIKDGYYYLLAKNENSDKIYVYRIDRMSDVKTLQEDSSCDIDPCDLELYKKRLFGMFGGECINLVIKIHKSLINMVYDIFGDEDIKLTKCNDEYYSFSCSVINSSIFKAWCCSYEDKLKVLAPKSFINELKDYINNLQNLYSE